METTTEISKLPVIAIYPEGTGGTNGSSWEGAPYSTGANDVQFTTDLLNELESKYCYVNIPSFQAQAKKESPFSKGSYILSLVEHRQRHSLTPVSIE